MPLKSVPKRSPFYKFILCVSVSTQVLQVPLNSQSFCRGSLQRKHCTRELQIVELTICIMFWVVPIDLSGGLVYCVCFGLMGETGALRGSPSKCGEYVSAKQRGPYCQGLRPCYFLYCFEVCGKEQQGVHCCIMLTSLYGCDCSLLFYSYAELEINKYFNSKNQKTCCCWVINLKVTREETSVLIIL